MNENMSQQAQHAAWVSRLRAASQVVRYDPARRCFVDAASNRRLAGVTEPLRAAFFPHYDRRSAPRTTSRPGRTGGSGRGGRARGSRVDAEVAACVNRGAAPTHPYTRIFLSALRRAGLTPLAAQVPVGDPSTCLGTAVDLVCARRGALYLVELKCGWNEHAAYEAPQHRMACGLGDSPRNQHALQLLVTRYLFRVTFGLAASACHAAVARVSDDGVRFYPLNRRVAALEADVVRALAAHVRSERAAGRSRAAAAAVETPEARAAYL